MAPLLGRTTAGDQLGEPMVLPGDYVANHVALGYAATVHATQGLNVGTSKQVITSGTHAEAALVGLTRGAESNTAFVVTRSVPDDVPTGTVNQVLHRSAVAVLAGILDNADPTRTAFAQALESAADANSIRTPADAARFSCRPQSPGRPRLAVAEVEHVGSFTCAAGSTH